MPQNDLSLDWEQIHRQLDSIKGFLDPDEGRRLFALARDAKGKGPVLEIGSYCGKSAVYLGLGCQTANRFLFSVDHHRGSEEQQPGEEYFDPELYDVKYQVPDSLPCFRQTITRFGLDDVVIPIVGKSEIVADAWQAPLSMLFIDGGHAFETVFRDFEKWHSKIEPGGILAIHDIFPNPEQGGQAPYEVYQKALAHNHFEPLVMTKTLGVLQKGVAP